MGSMPLCENKTEFFGLCTHIVYSKNCRNPDRFWGGGAYHDPAGCCGASCVVRELPPLAHVNGRCL